MSNIHDAIDALDDSIYLKYRLVHKDAIAPTYDCYKRSVGYDLNLVDHVKTEGKLEYYTTGVQIELPHDIFVPDQLFHCEIFPRAILPQTGYLLVNNIGLINGESKELIACLFKFDKDAPKLELPQKLIQLVIRKSCIHGTKKVKEFAKIDENGDNFESISKKRKIKK